MELLAASSVYPLICCVALPFLCFKKYSSSRMILIPTTHVIDNDKNGGKLAKASSRKRQHDTFSVF